MQQIQDEIIVIGGGLAGIVASLELITQGKRVTLLDRDLIENLGGQAKESFGGLFVVDSLEQRRSGFRDTPEQAWQDWLSFGEFHDQDDWPRRWAETYVHTCRDEVYLWLKQLGAVVPAPAQLGGTWSASHWDSSPDSISSGVGALPDPASADAPAPQEPFPQAAADREIRLPGGSPC